MLSSSGFLGIRKLAGIMPYTILSIIVSFVCCTTIEDGSDFARFDKTVTYALCAVGKENAEC